MQNKRQSNIELARILAMLFIVGYHLLLHYVPSIISKEFLDVSMSNQLFASFLYGGGGIGVGLFFMISGYYLTYANKRKSIKKIVTAVFFYAFLGCLCYIFKFFMGKEFDKLDFFKYLFIPVSSGIWWFPTAYVLIVFAAPSINEVVSGWSKRGFVIVLLFVNLFWFFLNGFYETAYHRLGQALFWYLSGGFYRRFLTEKRYSFYVMLFLTITSLLCFTLLEYSYLIFFAKNENWKLLTALSFFRVHIVLPLAVFLLFYLFLNIKINSNVINFFSRATFGVYLGHENFYMAYILRSALLNLNGAFSKNYFACKITLVTAGVFVLLSVVETFRLRLIEPLAFKIINSVENSKFFNDSFNLSEKVNDGNKL